MKNPAHYLNLHADKLVILDEVQRYPDLFTSLRGVIDARRREGVGNGRFLILGSASNVLLKQSSESLAGRINYLELSGLNLFFYRTSAGSEIDLLLEFNFGEYWAIEIKSSRTTSVKKGFHMACDDLGVMRKFIVYPGEDTFLLNDITVMSLPLFMEELRTSYHE